MKTLFEYLSTKVKLHKNNEFPKFPSKRKFIEFLEYNGFEELPVPDKDVDIYLEEKARISKTPIYITEEVEYERGIYWIRFCNPGMISYSNPILFCYLTDDYTSLIEFKKYLNDHLAPFFGYNTTAGREIKDWEDFEEEFKKYYTIV